MSTAVSRNRGDRATNVLLAGVGGHGVLAASETLALAALAEGLETKQSEVHGVAQRGGSVVSHVRFGSRVHSPLIRCGEVHLLYASEQLEALRHAHTLESRGTVVMSDQVLEPISYPGQPEQEYPREVPAFLRGKGFTVILIPALHEAMELGDKRCANIVLLGALARFLPLRPACWNEAITTRFPPAIRELNAQAFERGREFADGAGLVVDTETAAD